jgi:hypothetical protein
MALITLLGLRLAKNRSVINIGVTTLTASVVFFLLTNFAVWTNSGMYPLTFAGLQACYIAALPFFQNSLAGDAFYAVVLFGGVALAELFVPSLRPVQG